ncbi:MAG: transcriptional regulator [Chloroflexota bacterium]|nr:transcriptional regulator [Chloroflexota bacterium]
MTQPPRTNASGTSALPPVSHPRLQLNEAIHQPVKLSILASLAHAERVDFAFLRDYLGLKDSNLSQHLTALESLGYITIDKQFEKKRARTWLAITPAGRAAFEEYLAVLRQIVERPEQPPSGS